jgi:hypothetical protein
MAIKLEVGKQYITRDGTEYTAPLELRYGFGDMAYTATTYKRGTTISTASRTWTYGGSWIGIIENDLDLVAEYNPEEIKMDEKVVVNIEVGKTYRTREGKEVTLEPWDSYTLKGSNDFLYNKSLTGSVYRCEHSEFDIVEEVMKEPVTTFTTQQEVFKHLASGGYISCSGVNIYGFTEEGILASFDIYGDFMYKVNFTFNAPSDWQVATIEPKPVPRWEDALKDKKILCKVGYREDDLYLVAVIHDLLSDADYPYESVEGQVYTFAVPLTLEEVTKHIYECE